MPRQKNKQFNSGWLVQLLAIPVMSAGLGLIGWYYLTLSDHDHLVQHDKQILDIQNDRKAVADVEKKDRDEARKAFLDNQLKTADILSKLDVRLAVSETKQEQTNITLNKIADELSRISTMAPRR